MLLEIRNLSCHYHRIFSARRHYILRDISFSIDKNSNVALLGPSGGGKSSLAKAIAKIIPCDKDSKILLEGEEPNVRSLSSRRDFYRRAQILFQDCVSSLNPRLNVFENLKEPLLYLLNIKDRSEQERRIESVLGRLDLDTDILFKYPLMLSGGQAQRVCFARAFMIEPKLLILDETLSGLDYELQEKVINLLLEKQRENLCSYLLITHDIVLARRFCDQFMLMDSGRIIEIARKKDIGYIFSQELGAALESCFMD